MNDYQKINNSICVYCDCRLVAREDTDKRDCPNCGAYYWYRDDGPGYWSNNGPSEEYRWKLLSEEFIAEFPDLSHWAIIDFFAARTNLK